VKERDKETPYVKSYVRKCRKDDAGGIRVKIKKGKETLQNKINHKKRKEKNTNY
jgi:hypothetical protein